jgi:hypothetical protein
MRTKCFILSPCRASLIVGITYFTKCTIWQGFTTLTDLHVLLSPVQHESFLPCIILSYWQWNANKPYKLTAVVCNQNELQVLEKLLSYLKPQYIEWFKTSVPYFRRMLRSSIGQENVLFFFQIYLCCRLTTCLQWCHFVLLWLFDGVPVTSSGNNKNI